MVNATHKVKYAEVCAHRLMTIKQQEADKQMEYWPEWYKNLFVTGRIYWGKEGYLTVKRNQMADEKPEYGDWLVCHKDGRLEVMTRTAFEMRYEDINAGLPSQPLLEEPPI